MTGTLKNPTKCLWRWEPDRRSNFFFNPPAHLCAVTYMTEMSLIVTLNNQFTLPYLTNVKWHSDPWPTVTSLPIRLSTNFMTFIPSLTFTELWVVSMEHLQRVWLASRERLPFRTPLYSTFHLEYPLVLPRFCFCHNNAFIIITGQNIFYPPPPFHLLIFVHRTIYISSFMSPIVHCFKNVSVQMHQWWLGM